MNTEDTEVFKQLKAKIHGEEWIEVLENLDDALITVQGPKPDGHNYVWYGFKNHSLYTAFAWGDTNQGFDYWSDIHRRVNR